MCRGSHRQKALDTLTRPCNIFRTHHGFSPSWSRTPESSEAPHEMELEQIGALLFAALCGALIPLIIMRQQKPSAASTAPSGGCPFGFGNSDAPPAASAPAETATTRPRARSNSGCPFGYGNGAAAEALGFETGTAPEAATAAPPQRVMVSRTLIDHL